MGDIIPTYYQPLLAHNFSFLVMQRFRNQEKGWNPVGRTRWVSTTDVGNSTARWNYITSSNNSSWNAILYKIESVLRTSDTV